MRPFRIISAFGLYFWHPLLHFSQVEYLDYSACISMFIYYIYIYIYRLHRSFAFQGGRQIQNTLTYTLSISGMSLLPVKQNMEETWRWHTIGRSIHVGWFTTRSWYTIVEQLPPSILMANLAPTWTSRLANSSNVGPFRLKLKPKG